MAALPPLLSPSQVVSRAFLPGWFALAFAGGAVNATALAACRRFVAHVTGSLTHLAMDYAVRYEKMPWYPYTRTVTRGVLTTYPDATKEIVLATVLACSNLFLLWNRR